MASINGEAVVVPKEAVPSPPKTKGKGKAKPTTAEAKAAQQALADIPKARAELAKQLEELRKKSQGGSC
jgi:Tfp pilus assembly protein FimV